jgi:hypothetical protein
VTVRSGTVVSLIDVDVIPLGFRRAELRFHDLVPPRRSFELRVFLGAPDAAALTSTSETPRYLGSQYFYGVGPSEGAADAKADPRDPQQFAPVEIRLNITERLRALLASHVSGVMPLSVVAVDRTGTQIDDPGLNLQGVSIVTM